MTPCPTTWRVAAVIALTALVGPLARAQAPYYCYPDIYTLTNGPEPFPNPYPGNALTTPGTAERPAIRLPFGVAPHRADEARSAGAARPAAGGGTSCATDYRAQSWNGTAWDPDREALTATYDAAGRLLTLSSSHPDEGGQLSLDTRETFVYNAAGYPTSYLYERTLGGTSLQPYRRTTLTYSGAGRLSGYLEEEATTDGWAFDYRTTFSYGSGPYATLVFFEFWDGSAWQNDSRETNTYTASNQRATYTSEQWENSGWVNSDREQYVYDGAGRLTSWTDENPGDPTGWLLNIRDLYVYDGAGLVAEDRFQAWTGSAWQDQFLGAYSYAGGQLSTAVNSAINPDGSLTPAFRERFGYASGHLAEVAQDIWEGTAWQLDSRILYTRDAASRPTELLRQRRAKDGSSLVNSDREQLLYDGSIATEGGPASEALDLHVWPNPASTAATLRVTLDAPATVRLVVTDALGRDVLTDVRALAAGPQTLAVDAARLAPGVYVVRVAAGVRVGTHRLVVSR